MLTYTFNIRRNKIKKGFTLIELLVVVLIIGILAAVALPQYQAAVLKARAQEGILWGKRIIDAQEIYYITNGAYTGDWSMLDVDGLQSSYASHVRENEHYSFVLEPYADVRIHPKKHNDYSMRFFMKHIGWRLNGKVMNGKRICLFKENNIRGKRFCTSLCGNNEAFVYNTSKACELN